MFSGIAHSRWLDGLALRGLPEGEPAMMKPVDSHSLFVALKAAGFVLPDNTFRAELTIGVDQCVDLTLHLHLSEADLQKIGAAMVTFAVGNRLSDSADRLPCPNPIDYDVCCDACLDLCPDPDPLGVQLQVHVRDAVIRFQLPNRLVYLCEEHYQLARAGKLKL